MIRLRIAARKTHKWLGLLLGVQLVIWSLTGLYMTVVHIDVIHGDHLIREARPHSVDPAALLDPISVAKDAEGNAVRLTWVRDAPAYVVGEGNTATLLDARSGGSVRPINDRDVRKIARQTYTGTEQIKSIELITDIPNEIRGRTAPIWRVEFEHWNKPTLYFSPLTGELLTRRHELWRVFDFAWMLHIMEYEDRENVNNTLLRVFTISAFLMALSGAWMLLYAFPKKKKKKRKPAQ